MPTVTVTLADLYDVNHPVNRVGTTINGYIVRDRWNQTATVRVVDHPADSDEFPAYFTNKAALKTWKLGSAKPGTAHVLSDFQGVDIVIPGSERTLNPVTPPVPTGFTTGIITTSAIDLYWDPAPVDTSIQEYHLEQLIVGHDSYYTRIATLNRSVNTYLARDLPPNALVRFRIRAYDVYASEYAYTEGITLEESSTGYPPVQSFSAQNTALNTQLLTWVYPVTEGVTSFRLERLVAGVDTDFVFVQDFDLNTFSYTDATLPNDTVVQWRIRAEDDGDPTVSPWSNTSLTTLPAASVNAPIWTSTPGPVLGEEADLDTLTYNLAVFVDANGSALKDWDYFPKSEGLSINTSTGLLSFTEDYQEFNALIYGVVSNDDGTTYSDTFSIQIIPETGGDDVVVFCDNFDRADANLDSGQWFPPSVPLQITNNEVKQLNTGVPEASAIYGALMPSSTQYAEVDIIDIATTSDTNHCGVYTRLTDDGAGTLSYYKFVVKKGSIAIIRIDGAATPEVTLAELAYDVPLGARLRGLSNGGTHEIWIGGILTLAVTDNTYLPDQSLSGIVFRDNLSEFTVDNYCCGTPGTSPSNPGVQPPTAFRVTSTGTSFIRLEWQHAGVVQTFRLERFLVGTDTSWQLVTDTIAGLTRLYDDTGLTEGKTYLYRLQAHYTGNEPSTWAETEGTTTVSAGLNSPYNQVIASVTHTSQTLTWDYDGSANTGGFELQRYEVGVDPGWMPEATLAPGDRTHTTSGLTSNADYEHQIRALGDGGSFSTPWKYFKGYTAVNPADEVPAFSTVSNQQELEENLPFTMEMDSYRTSSKEIVSWSATNHAPVSIDSGGTLTVNALGNYSIVVTGTDIDGLVGSTNSFQVSIVEEFGTVHYAESRAPLRINNPRPVGDNPGGINPDSVPQVWNRYWNTHSQVPYEVPIGVGMGRPPFKFQISGAPGFTIEAKAPSWNPGMTSWAVVKAAAGVTGTYTVTVTDIDGDTQSVAVPVALNDSRFIFVSPGGNDSNDGSIGSPIATCQEWYGTIGTEPSGYQEKIIVYREGSHMLPYSTASDTVGKKGRGLWGDRWQPMVHIGFPGETVTLTGNELMWNGFRNNDQNGDQTGQDVQPVRDMFFANLKLDAEDKMSQFLYMNRGLHRTVWWDVEWARFNPNVADWASTPSNYGPFTLLGHGAWEKSSVSLMDIRLSGMSYASANFGYVQYSTMHVNLDGWHIPGGTRQGENIFFKGDSLYCSATSLDFWGEVGNRPNPGKSTIRMSNYDAGEAIGTDYGIPVNQSAAILTRYCRMWVQTQNSQTVFFQDGGLGRETGQNYWERNTDGAWIYRKDKPTRGIGTYGKDKSGQQLLVYISRNVHYYDQTFGVESGDYDTLWDLHNNIQGVIEEASSNISLVDGTLLDTNIQYLYGYQVPLVVPSTFINDDGSTQSKAPGYDQ